MKKNKSVRLGDELLNWADNVDGFSAHCRQALREYIENHQIGVEYYESKKINEPTQKVSVKPEKEEISESNSKFVKKDKESEHLDWSKLDDFNL